MKPANFPGRKNARRITALARITDPRLKHSDKAGHPYYTTKNRIMTDDVARMIRTKKDRSARGVFRK
jgi:hypothetical protein